MGYTTDFSGSCSLSRELTKTEKDYINLLCSTRRMKRDVTKLMAKYKGEHGLPFMNAVSKAAQKHVDGLKKMGYTVQLSGKLKDTRTAEEIYGHEGEYFAMDDGQYGQSTDETVIDGNTSAKSQPGLWCGWQINDENELDWNGGEKFYHYVEWLKYLIAHFFEKWGVKLNGEIFWTGEDSSDMGKIVVTDNVVTVFDGVPQYIARG